MPPRHFLDGVQGSGNFQSVSQKMRDLNANGGPPNQSPSSPVKGGEKLSSTCCEVVGEKGLQMGTHTSRKTPQTYSHLTAVL